MNPTAVQPTQSRYYVLAILTLVYAFNHIDRQVLVILLEPIRKDLGLQDWHLGLLSGLGFAAVYSTVGIPVAIWADRGVRRDIVALSLGVWSFMTVLSGFAQTYWHLLLARMGVGLGEAGGTPPATSMIADLYPPSQRATALGVYTLGIGLGILAGFPLGGYVYELHGWRAAFFVAGAPGLVLALIVWLTVREPQRGQSEARVDTARPTIGQTFTFMLSQPAFLWLLAGCMLICVSANAFLGELSFDVFNAGLCPAIQKASVKKIETSQVRCQCRCCSLSIDRHIRRLNAILTPPILTCATQRAICTLHRVQAHRPYGSYQWRFAAYQFSSFTYLLSKTCTNQRWAR